MVNWKQIFVCVLVITVVQTIGSVAAAQQVVCGTVSATPTMTDPPLSASGDAAWFTVNNASECFWKVTGAFDDLDNPVDWIDITSYSWVFGSADTVQYTVDANLGEQRTGFIRVDNTNVHTVIQEAAPCLVTVHNSPTSADHLFVANTACDRIVQLDGGWAPVYEETPSTYEGLEFGPDGWLYAFDPALNRGIIYSFNPSNPAEFAVVHTYSNDGAPEKPREGVFNHLGDLIVVDGATGDLYTFTNVNDVGQTISFGSRTPITDPDGFGTAADITTAADGDLLVTDSGNRSVWRIPFDPVFRSYDSTEASQIVTTGLAGAPGAITRTADGTIFVGDFVVGENTSYLRRFEQDGTPALTCEDFYGAVIQDIDIASDDTFYVTVVTADNVAEVYEMPLAACSVGDPTKLATFTDNNQLTSPPPLVGVAVPFTSRDPGPVNLNQFPGIGDNVQVFNFFDQLYEFEPVYFAPDAPLCEVTMTQHEFSPQFIQERLDGMANIPPVTLLTNWGDNGAVQVYDYHPTAGSTCTPENVDFYRHSINAKNSGENVHIVVCHGDNLQDWGTTPTECELLSYVSYFADFGFLPNDGRTTGGGRGFSWSFAVDNPGGVPEEYAATFCGPDSPLTDMAPWPEFQTGSSVPIKFRVQNVPGGQGDCKKDFIAQGLNIVLEVAKIEPNFDPIDDVTLVGGAADTIAPTFRNPGNPNKSYSADLKLIENGVNYEPGFYRIRITDQTIADPRVFYFPAQEFHFYVKQ